MNIANHRYQIKRQPARIRFGYMYHGTDIRVTETIGERFSAGLARFGDRVGAVGVYGDTATIPGQSHGTYMMALYSYGEPIAFMTADGLRMYVCNHHTFSFSVTTSAHISTVHTFKNGWRESGRAIWRLPVDLRWSGGRKIEFTEYVRTAADRDAAMAEHAATYGFTRNGAR